MHFIIPPAGSLTTPQLISRTYTARVFLGAEIIYALQCNIRKYQTTLPPDFWFNHNLHVSGTSIHDRPESPLKKINHMWERSSYSKVTRGEGFRKKFTAKVTQNFQKF